MIAFASDLELADTTMVLAMSGWVDAASVSTNAAERIAEGGRQIAAFDPDALFDYRSSRPVMHFTSGELTEIAWPRLEVFHRGIDGVDFVIVKGHEPDFRWKELTICWHALSATRMPIPLLCSNPRRKAVQPVTRIGMHMLAAWAIAARIVMPLPPGIMPRLTTTSRAIPWSAHICRSIAKRAMLTGPGPACR